VLSYIWEFHIESAPSEVNPHLYVSLKSGRYQLSTAHAIYSFEDKYDNFFDSFTQLDLDKLPGDKVLILGLGLASIPFMLEKKFERSYEYTGVELDEAVIYLASKYVLDDLKSSMQLAQADAFKFLEMTSETYDLVIMDVFVDDEIPKEMERSEFLETIKKCMHPDGLFMYNRLAYHEKDISKSKKYFEQIFKQAFKDACYLEVKGNFMLLNRADMHS
jgi:spermidine synthase